VFVAGPPIEIVEVSYGDMESRDAKAKFCELLRETEKQGSQVITRRGKEMVVFVSIEEWRQVKTANRAPAHANKVKATSNLRPRK
jgi:prevent-host-death family protein